jgi:ATP-dependent helicase HrpB
MSGDASPDARELPIVEVLPELRAALAAHNTAVLVAPPGAGKTTWVPLALLDAPWRGDGKILVLEPRRLAARAAAGRMAETLGETVGQRVGYRVRLESRVTTATRVEVITEGVFTRMILEDPGLDGVAAVLFDEFHERSLDADLGLALARNSQALLRPDLRLLIMSATLDGARIARLLDEAPVIESVGRAFPVETRYLGRDPRLRLETQMAKAIRGALLSEAGDILAFLPGQAEILRTQAELLDGPPSPSVDVFALYGALDVAEQDRAVAPASPGRRKVVLASAIAETSLTLAGARIVIDSGLARRARWDPGTGLTRLTTTRVSRASADQRRGRAGRTAPGVCWRLWDEAETRALTPFDPPEILEADLSRLALDLARWGAADAVGLVFLDPPPAAALAEAHDLLRNLDALDAHGVLTAHGEALSRLPLPPRLAHMVQLGAGSGQARQAARLAMVLSERGLGGADTDISRRAQAFGRTGGGRARAALAVAERWAEAAGAPGQNAPLSDGLLIAAAFPERVGKARGAAGEFQLASGRGAFLDPTDPLAKSPWLAVAELGGGASRDRILLAAELDIGALRAAFPARFVSEDTLETTGGGGKRARRLLRLGALTVEALDLETPSPELISAALMEDIVQAGLTVLPWGPLAQGLRARLAFLRQSDTAWPDVSDDGLLAQREAWLAPLLAGRMRLGEITDSDIANALRGLIPSSHIGRLNAEAPVSWTSPAGSVHEIDYAAEGGARVDVRVQALFGLRSHPIVGGDLRLVLSLLSPAGRPIQLTRDLPGFWSGSWREVRKEMRGRYPKHPWPEDPAAAPPTLRAKPRS